jgi:hypothetical protein
VISLNFAEVRERVPIVSFLESLGCALQPEGNTYRTKCPIHNERRGKSFIVYPTAHWFCHGKCVSRFPRGGDIIDLASALWSIDRPREVITRLLGEIPRLDLFAYHLLPPSSPPVSKWPPRDLERIDQIVRNGPHFNDLRDLSPWYFDDSRNHAEEIVDLIFPGDPLLCVGLSAWKFATRRREIWRGRLARFPLMVPNPMLRTSGFTREGKRSEHTLEATAARVYLVVEFDFKTHHQNGTPTEFLPLIKSWEKDGISALDACSAIIWNLSSATQGDGLPLCLSVHSGDISLHGWYRAFGLDEQRVLLPFMQRAHSLGADPVTWTRSQFVRLPDGRRQNGALQRALYFNPLATIIS